VFSYRSASDDLQRRGCCIGQLVSTPVQHCCNATGTVVMKQYITNLTILQLHM